MAKALILGVSGQDGAYLARHLLEKGYTVFGASRDHLRNEFSNLAALGIRDQVQVCTILTTDFQSVIANLDALAPDEIYDLSGQSSVGLSFDRTIDTVQHTMQGILNILECLRMRASGARLFYAASSECFGDTPEPADETTAFRPRSPYAIAKAAAFWSVSNYRAAYGIHASSGIMFNHESPLRSQRFVTRKIVDGALAIANGSRQRLLLGNLDIERDWGWAPEYVAAMRLMLQQPRGDDYVIATGRSHRLEDFLELAFSKVGLNWRDHVDQDRKFYRPLDIAVSRANPAKAARDLGWSAKVSLDEIAQRMLDAVSRS